MVAAHILRHDITGNRARRADRMTMATSACSRKPMCTAIGRKMTGSRMSLMKAAAQVGPSFLMAFAPSNPAPMLSSAIGVAQLAEHAQELARHRRKSIDSSEKRQTGENAENDRVGDDAAQRASQRRDGPPCAVRRGHGQHEHREDVVKRHARHDHQRHKTGISVQILHKKATPRDGLRAAERALCERADHALVAQKRAPRRPRWRKSTAPLRRHRKKEELRVELLGDASGGDVAEQQDGQQLP